MNLRSLTFAASCMNSRNADGLPEDRCDADESKLLEAQKRVGLVSQRDEQGRFLVGAEPGPARNLSRKPTMDEQAYNLALLGLSYEEMVQVFGISRNTLHR
jgi:hypothetical protein